MKRLGVMLAAALAAMLMLVVPAYAYTLDDVGYQYEVRGGNTYLYLPTASLTEQQQTSIRNWLSSDRTMMWFYPDGRLAVARELAKRTTHRISKATSTTVTLNADFDSSCFYFYPASSQYKPEGPYINYTSTFQRILCAPLFVSDNISTDFLKADLYSGLFLQCEGDLYIEDDLGLFEGFCLKSGVITKPEIIKSYTLTVQYQHQDGTQAAPPHAEQLPEGSSYSVLSPALEGYEADTAVVIGTMPGQDTTVTVTYTALPPPEYSLTVVYQYADGRAAAPSHIESLPAGVSYSVPSPAISGYQPSVAVVSGTMPDRALQVTVTYEAEAPPPPVDPPDPPDPPPDPPPGPTDTDGSYRVLDFYMFADFFDMMRDNGAVLTTFFLKAVLLVTGVGALFGVVRTVILSALGRREDPHELR